jgi:hypothetical protein
VTKGKAQEAGQAGQEQVKHAADKAGEVAGRTEEKVGAQATKETYAQHQSPPLSHFIHGSTLT